MSDDPAPQALWIWVGLSGLALAVVLVGWNSARWWRRVASFVAVPLCVLSAGVALNQWVGYFPTVQTAWNQLTAGPLPDETDMATVTAMQQNHTVPTHGAVVPVTIPSDASHFKHRTELVYLPPAWFASNPPPKLPTVMMIAGEFNTPADWLRTGSAAKTMDDFARAHGGNAPVLVFVDSGGSFNNDTECVNGSRGNAADHLTKDVVPFMVSQFGVSSNSANWGIVGWSMGGTCAVDLTVMHPELFSSFVDIAGDLGADRGDQGPDDRAVVPRRRECVGRVRPDHGHHETWPLHRSLGLVRHLEHPDDPETQRQRQQRRRRPRRTRRRRQPGRPNRGREHTVRTRQSQRHQLHSGVDTGQA